MSIITINWKAFVRDDVPTTRKAVSATIQYDTQLDDESICEKAFRDTNTYSGELWDALQPLPVGRTHTSLSVGDEVTVDGRTYRCASEGWEAVEVDPRLAKAHQCLSIALDNIRRAEETIHLAVGHTYTDGQWSGTLQDAFVSALSDDELSNYLSGKRNSYTNALVERRLTIELRDKQFAIINECLG
jgi:hypothetical protein